MPKGYVLNSYYDAQRALQRKIYSKEIKLMSSVINKFGYLNSNLYGIAISQIRNGLEDNMGRLTASLHQPNKSDIGLNSNSRYQDFMSPLELRANSIAVRKAMNAVDSLGLRATVEDMVRACYEAGQSVGLEFQNLKICNKDVFCLKAQSPVLSTTPIIKKFDKALIANTEPKGDSLEYTGIQKEQKEDLINANKQKFLEVKRELDKFGLITPSEKINAFKSLNLGYYFVEDPKSSSLEMAALLFSDKYNPSIFYYTELCMNLEKLTMAKNMLEKLNKNLTPIRVYVELFECGKKSRNMAISTYKMLPEMFTGFYNSYNEAERINAIQKEKLQSARKIKKDDIKE